MRANVANYIRVWKKRTIAERRKRKCQKRNRLLANCKGARRFLISINNFQSSSDRKKLPLYRYRLREFLLAKGLNQENINSNNIISIPQTFSLSKNFQRSFDCLCETVGMLIKEENKSIVLDFSKCTETDFTALFPLKILLNDFYEHCEEIENKYLNSITIRPVFPCIKSREKKVNSYLVNAKFIRKTVDDTDVELIPLHTLGFYKGDKSQKRFIENKKSRASSDVVSYVNHCLNQHKFELRTDGINDLEGIISEILNNCEDHSPFNTWYLTANFLKVPNKEKPNDAIGELNIGFLNFGFSIYEGFEQTKDENYVIYQEMERLASNILQNFRTGYEKKDLFTLYALQEGVSRLKFEEESRGTGTIKFINSFLEMGDYESNESNHHPELTIISGSTAIICDPQYKPEQKENVFVIGLNPNNSLLDPPSKHHLKGLPSHFPGTIIGVKLYINKSHLQKKLGFDDNSGD